MFYFLLIGLAYYAIIKADESKVFKKDAKPTPPKQAEVKSFNHCLDNDLKLPPKN